MQTDELSPSSRRLFVAIDLPDFVVEAIQREIQIEEGHLKGVHWMEPRKLHLTLAFLGDVDAGRQTELGTRLSAATVKPFFLSLEGVGVFPGKGEPKVLWAGMAPVDPCLFQLHGKIGQILLDLGFEPERRRFHPHVTIARCGAGSGPAIRQIVKKHSGFGTAPFRVNGFSLYASQLTPRGASYTSLSQVRF